MLSYRQYKVLKQIDKYQKATSKNYKRGISQILSDDFFSKYTKYTQYTINTILTELHHQEYIKDTANEIDTDVHAVAITDKGYDTLYINTSKLLFFWFGAIFTFIIEHIFDIISFVNSLLSTN